MFNDTAVTSLRLTDRKRLLRHLLKLGDPDPQQRAEAGLAATQLLQEKGVSWGALVPVDRAEPRAVTAPPDWRSVALDLATHPGTTPTERSFALKVAA